MLYLRKIKDLKGYRFFQNYKWDETSCKLFDQNNLIYGWNGSGKTTLCDFFKDLCNGALSIDGATCSLLFEDSETKQTKTITQASLGSVPYLFRVFHQDYIRDNIKQDTVRHIFIVGKEQAEKLDEAKKLRSQASQQAALVKQLTGECISLMQEFDRLKTSNAKSIKDAAKYTNAYNKNTYYNAHNALSVKKILSASEYQNALTAIRAQPRPILHFNFPTLIQSTVKEYISDILSQTPVNKTIELLKADAAVGTWVEQGLSLHDTRHQTSCFFCGNPISQERYDELKKHFNKSYKELSIKIDKAIALLYEKHQQFEVIRQSIPNTGLLYEELQQQYQQSVFIANDLCDKYIATILGIIDILKRKKEDMINEALTTEFISLVDSLTFDYGIFEKIQEIILSHNKKTNEFQKSIQTAQKAVELHLISTYAEEISIFENRISNKNNECEKHKEKLEELTKQYSALEQYVRNSQIPADEINKDIAFIMGRSELVFTNTESGYLITRNGKRAQHLSKGEENAIALIYFFNSLKDVDINADNAIVVLDDPISSFDSNFYYNAISYIREKTLLVGQTFIFTHKFALIKDFSMMFKEKTNRYTISRDSNIPIIENESNLIAEYHDEYAYLFKKVYEFIKHPPKKTSEYLQYPNIARRVLEGFLTFKLPSTNTLMDKVIELERGTSSPAGRAVMRLLNNHSHLRIISSSDLADDIDNIASLPAILNHLMEFIRKHDKRHYDTLAKLSDPQYNIDGDAVCINKPIVREIPYYTMSASAGPGDFMDNNPPAQTIKVENPNCTFAVKISGNSMEPEVHDGNIVLVKKCEEVPNAHKGIVWYKGACYCKKLVKSPRGLMLVSENKAYSPILVESIDEYNLYGEVLEILPGDCENN